MPSTAKANRGPSAGPANRRALIDAAREIFATDGISAPLSAIAKRAGVGQGSLYRHFPERVDLAVAVFDENLGELEVEVARPETTLDDLLESVIEQALVSTTIIDMMTLERHDDRLLHLQTRMDAIIGSVLEREKAAGRIGTHVVAGDVLLAISMLASMLVRTDATERRAVAARAWSLFHAAFAPH